MKTYIAYFDFLGFKEFINQSSEEKLEQSFKKLYLTITESISDNYIQQTSNTIQSDINRTKINFLNISDTVIFWTNDNDVESFKELIEVVYRFNAGVIKYFLPVRGCVIYDYFKFKNGQMRNEQEAFFGINYMYGKGLINAHYKTEQMNWSGTVVDFTVVDEISKNHNFIELIKEYAKLYKVPYKGFYRNEYTFLFAKETEINDKEEFFKRFSSFFYSSFEGDGKSISPHVEEIMNNTITFLKSHIN